MGILLRSADRRARERTVNDYCCQLLRKGPAIKSSAPRAAKLAEADCLRRRDLLHDFTKVTASTSRLSEQLVSTIHLPPGEVEGLGNASGACRRRGRASEGHVLQDFSEADN